jgi:hypothetical protein
MASWNKRPLLSIICRLRPPSPLAAACLSLRLRAALLVLVSSLPPAAEKLRGHKLFCSALFCPQPQRRPRPARGGGRLSAGQGHTIPLGGGRTGDGEKGQRRRRTQVDGAMALAGAEAASAERLRARWRADVSNLNAALRALFLPRAGLIQARVFPVRVDPASPSLSLLPSRPGLIQERHIRI